MTEIKIGSLVKWHDSTFLKIVGIVLDREIRYSRTGETVECFKVHWSPEPSVQNWFSADKLRVVDESR